MWSRICSTQRIPAPEPAPLLSTICAKGRDASSSTLVSPSVESRVAQPGMDAKPSGYATYSDAGRVASSPLRIRRTRAQSHTDMHHQRTRDRHGGLRFVDDGLWDECGVEKAAGEPGVQSIPVVCKIFVLTAPKFRLYR